MSEDELVHLRRQVAACRDTNRYVGPCTQCEPSAPWGEMFACGEEADGSEDDEGTLYIQRLVCAPARSGTTSAADAASSCESGASGVRRVPSEARGEPAGQRNPRVAKTRF